MSPAQREAVVALCCRVGGLRQLDVLEPGIAVDSECDDGQPLRFLVELADAPPPEYADRWFSLKEGLEQLLQRPVLLLTPPALINPYRRAAGEAQREGVFFSG